MTKKKEEIIINEPSVVIENIEPIIKDTYVFLSGYEGKIVVIRGTEKKDGTKIIPQWKKEREKHLYNGKISNQNLREKLITEWDVEFDFNEKWDIGSDEFNKAQKEAEKWINKIKEELISNNSYFYITDHKGKSPHVRGFTKGLEYHPLVYALEYKLVFVKEILKAIHFKPEMVHLDEGLITSQAKLISLEEVPHWKEVWGGAVEKIVFENKEGKIPEVKPDLMKEIIDGINEGYKSDNKAISSEPIKAEDVDVEALIKLFKEHYKQGTRNNLIIAFSGICVKKDIPLEKAQGILKNILENIGYGDNYKDDAEIKVEYAYDLEDKKVAIYHHLKQVFKDKELHSVYDGFINSFRSDDEVKYQKVKLSQLNASFIGKDVSVDCQITGEQSQKAVPEKIEMTCQTCGASNTFNPYDHPVIFLGEKLFDTLIIKLKTKVECVCRFNKDQNGDPAPLTPRITHKIRGYADHSILFVRDMLVKDEKFIQGNYEPKRIYIIGKELPKTKVINICGRVMTEPKTNNISIIATEIRPLKNQVEDFQITEEMKQDFKKYFNGKIDLADEINPDIVGEKRKIAKKSVITLLHSPCQIWDIQKKKIIRGGIKIINIGDTKVGKSEIAKDVTNKGNYELGEYVVAETGGRTGFLYTIDSDKGALIWGTLPLNDMGLIVLDGLQSINTEEMGEFREALELQEVIVNRSIKGSALARTRIIGCLNPFKPMNQYIYRCEAITDNFVFKNTPEVTRWDLFLSFCQKDVPSEEIAQRTFKERQIPKEVFINHIYWVWSRRPDHIEYTPTAISEIKDKSQEFINEYSLETLPIVHNGVRDILTRLSVSKACELHSTDETHERVIVEKEHVTKASEFYKEVLDLIELGRYKQDIEGKSEISEDDMKQILMDIGKTEYQIIQEIKFGGKSSTDLSVKLNVAEKTIKRHYDKLREHSLIETKKGKGISLNARGIMFVKWCFETKQEPTKEKVEAQTGLKEHGEKTPHYEFRGVQGTVDMGTNNVPNKEEGDKSSPHVYSERKGGISLVEEKSAPFVPVEDVLETPLDKIMNYIREHPECSHSEVYDAVKIVDHKVGDNYVQILKDKREIYEPRSDRLRVLE